MHNSGLTFEILTLVEQARGVIVRQSEATQGQAYDPSRMKLSMNRVTRHSFDYLGIGGASCSVMQIGASTRAAGSGTQPPSFKVARRTS